MQTINNLKLSITHSEKDLLEAICKELNNFDKSSFTYRIKRKSLDARKKSYIHYVYNVEVFFSDELVKEDFKVEKKSSKLPIVIVGCGPAGLFCGLTLAEAGLQPIIIEQGASVNKRITDIDNFWNNGILNTNSNVLFGEGGAGTFSDGKLTTQISDKNGYCQKVFSKLIWAGASPEIAYLNKPHIGTDVLRKIISVIREKIIESGGKVLFDTKLTGLNISDNKLQSIITNNKDEILTNHLVLAIGHSSRDTINLLFNNGVAIEPKAFSIGVRIEHPQELINIAQYGNEFKNPNLPAADYKLVQHLKSGRSLYSFCMCPGGKVIASSSEKNTIVTNGMSYSKRNSINANSALLVGVTPDDFPTKHPLSGIEFQRELEQKAYKMSGKSYHAPAQRLEDFFKKRPTSVFNTVKPSYKPDIYPCNLHELLPIYVADSIMEGIKALDNKLKGFAYPDAVLTAIETRSSSPVRIIRGADYQSINIKGLYPCGEGAGYAGGITSSAIDGLKVALMLYP